MNHVLTSLKRNTRFQVVMFGMTLVTVYAWRSGWKEGMFATFCTTITGLALAFIGPHTYESVKNPAAPVASTQEQPK